MKDDYFLRRVDVKTADLARSAAGVRAVNASSDRLMLIQRASMALDQADVNDATLKLIDDAFSTGPLGPKLLKAFWSEHRIALSPIAGSRLMINPPEGLDPGSPSPISVSTQPWLCGRYGLCIPRLPTSVEMINVESENPGFFDDVSVFLDLGIDAEEASKFCNYVMPGSTVTMVRPNLKLHGRWMATADLDLSFSGLIERLEEQFNLKPLVQSGVEHVHSITLGIESK